MCDNATNATENGENLEKGEMEGNFWRRRPQMGEIGAEGATNVGIEGERGRKEEGRGGKRGEFRRWRVQK